MEQKMKNKFDVQITNLDKTEEIEEKLFSIFSQIFQGIDADKFKLFSINDIGYGENIRLKYSVHYGQNKIEFTPILSEFWKVECGSFAEKQVKFFSKYPRTGNYLYANTDGKVASMKDRLSISESILACPAFRIFDDGSTNAPEIASRLNEQKLIEKESVENEKREKQLADEHEMDIRTVSEFCDITFGLNYSTSQVDLKTVLEKVLTPFKSITEIVVSPKSFYRSSYEEDNEYQFGNKQVTLRYNIPLEYAYPFDVASEKVHELADKMRDMFAARLVSKKFDYRFFSDEAEALDYVSRRKAGNEDISRVIDEILAEQKKSEEEASELANKVEELQKRNKELNARLESYKNNIKHFLCDEFPELKDKLMLSDTDSEYPFDEYLDKYANWEESL